MPGQWSARAAKPSDHPHFVRLFPELGVDDPTPDAARWERDLMPRTLFLEADSGPIAYALWGKLDDMGYVMNVVVDPAFRGRGVGGALMEATAEALRREGLSRWSLNVKVDNTPALRLYERFGFKRSHASTALVLDWERISELPREPIELSARFIDPAEDAALEAAFDKPAGRLRQLRARTGMMLLRLVDPARPGEAKIAMAAFDPQFPGSPLFAAARPTLAAPLLDAIRPHARPGDTSTFLLVEADPALDALLRATGARVRHELLYMRGEIPRR